MDVENLLDAIDGRLTREVIMNPDTKDFIWSLQKHIRFALNNPTKADIPKLMRKSHGWITAMGVKYPQFGETFFEIKKLIEEHGI